MKQERKSGCLRVYGEIFHYELQRFDKCSREGLYGGRIYSLTLKRNGGVVYRYEKGEQVAPADQITEVALQLLLHSENY